MFILLLNTTIYLKMHTNKIYKRYEFSNSATMECFILKLGEYICVYIKKGTIQMYI